MNLFNTVKCEETGVSSRWIEKFIDSVEKNNICLHSCMMIKNQKVICEAYWEPVKKNELHRLYSSTKSFVSISIGLLIDKGLLSFDDKIIKFFPDLIDSEKLHPYVAEATVQDLLRMSTPYSESTYGDPDICGKDWLASYFYTPANHPSGTIYNYDSCGSYVLGAIVRRVTGKHFYEFLREEMLDEMGFAKESRCILGPDKESWAGSGILLSMRDFAKFALLLLNKGRWNDKQMISEEYVTAATTRQVDNNTDGENNPWHCGYGYQFWILKDEAFCMLGAASQLAVCIPKYDFIFVCNADTQGRHGDGSRKIFNILWDEIVDNLKNQPEDDANAYESLVKRCSNLKIAPVQGNTVSDIVREINDITFKMNDNPMQISEISLHLEKDCGSLSYCNSRGKKTILFGIGKCICDKFPEKHFNGEILGESANREFRSVNSGAWVEENKFVIRCNIIDMYVGNLTITLCFNGDEIALSMYKNAQFFLKEYDGYAGGIAMRNYFN